MCLLPLRYIMPADLNMIYEKARKEKRSGKRKSRRHSRPMPEHFERSSRGEFAGATPSLLTQAEQMTASVEMRCLPSFNECADRFFENNHGASNHARDEEYLLMGDVLHPDSDQAKIIQIQQWMNAPDRPFFHNSHATSSSSFQIYTRGSWAAAEYHEFDRNFATSRNTDYGYPASFSVEGDAQDTAYWATSQDQRELEREVDILPEMETLSLDPNNAVISQWQSAKRRSEGRKRGP
ncbi:hypothetical protein TWF730_008975 [Orbilia blumenaviensis]|uniref:Uncharacterized protein n=1 Tax=Orbilia blumenaviensis TaxID=1796055 RepID=A0AAV9UX68_9PEZI